MARGGSETPISLRAIIVYLKSPFGGALSAEQVRQKLGSQAPSRVHINRIYKAAIDRGFNPSGSEFIIQDEFINDLPRSGRPTKQTEDNARCVIAKIQRDRYGREKNCADIAGDLERELNIDISQTTIWRILRKHGYKKTKPTRKPGLSKSMKEVRLKFAQDHQD
jgi:hypothetical protein